MTASDSACACSALIRLVGEEDSAVVGLATVEVVELSRDMQKYTEANSGGQDVFNKAMSFV